MDVNVKTQKGKLLISDDVVEVKLLTNNSDTKKLTVSLEEVAAYTQKLLEESYSLYNFYEIFFSLLSKAERRSYASIIPNNSI